MVGQLVGAGVEFAVGQALVLEFHRGGVGAGLCLALEELVDEQVLRIVASGVVEGVQHPGALDVWQAYQGLTTATEALQTTRDLVASAEQSERVALGRYKAGVGTVLDLLSAQSALAAARVERIRAELDWNIYRATLAQAMGALDYSLLQAAEGRP